MKSVIARVIRNTRLQDSGYIIDMHDWIDEARAQLHTQQATSDVFEDVDICFHKAKLPCGLVSIDAVNYNGQRMERRSDVRTVNGISPGLDSCCGFYNIETPGYISTTFADGRVRIFFQKLPVDEDGLPLIPDNENYKQAVYWYVRAMMIGSGYPDKQFTFKECLELFEKLYAPRAIAEIRYPSPDEMEHRVRTFVRLLPDPNYFDNFFQSGGCAPEDTTQTAFQSDLMAIRATTKGVYDKVTFYPYKALVDGETVIDLAAAIGNGIIEITKEIKPLVASQWSWNATTNQLTLIGTSLMAGESLFILYNLKTPVE